jgi:exodeoxyribonuclease-5
MEIVLSNEQTIINKALELFVLQGNGNIDHEIILIGYAGTGKTTLITKFLGDMLYDKKCKRIAIAAPTHKAVNIIKNKLFNNFKNKDVINKYIEITTIQRLLNYKNYINSNGERYFSMGSSEPLWSIYDIIIIDECSMLSDQIIDDIQSIIKKPKNKNVKVIYVGDPAQLPPVNQQSSKIFKENIHKIIKTRMEILNINDE